MNSLLELLIANAIAVVPLAALAVLVSRVARRPALTHALWVLVLIKFVTPSFFRLPISIHVPVASFTASRLNDDDRASVRNQAEDASSSDALSRPSAGEPRVASEPVSLLRANDSPIPSVPGAADEPRPVVTPSAGTRFDLAMPIFVRSLLALWLLGSLAWLARQLYRGHAFFRFVLPSAEPHRALQCEAQRIGEHFGVWHVPRVYVVQATIPPMLWGLGRQAWLLFPETLAARLDEQASSTIVAHELAHYARRDHWVRLLELCVTAVFWWHPLVWIARRRIEEAEEECCDAWVISSLPHSPRRYAEALLDTIDFLCEAPLRLPPAASGLGQVPHLRRRLTKIMNGVSPKQMSLGLRCGFAMFATLLLPLQPFILGSAPDSQTSPRARAVVELASSELPADPAGSEDLDDAQAVARRARDFLKPKPAAELPSASLLPRSTSRLRAARGERTWGIAVSPNGHYVAQVTTGRRLFLTDVRTNGQKDLSAARITAIAFLPSGEQFVAADGNGRIAIWDAARGRESRVLLELADVVRSLAVSPDGQWIAIGTAGGVASVLDVRTDAESTPWLAGRVSVNCVRFSPDGERLAAACGDWQSDGPGEVTVWDLATGEQETLPCAASPGAVAFASRDELIVGLWNGHTSLWNLTNRGIVASAIADKAVVAAAAFSPDCPLLREVVFAGPNEVAFKDAARNDAARNDAQPNDIGPIDEEP